MILNDFNNTKLSQMLKSIRKIRLIRINSHLKIQPP